MNQVKGNLNVEKKLQEGIIHLVHTQNFLKNQNFLPLIRTRTYQCVTNVSFRGNFGCVVNE